MSLDRAELCDSLFSWLQTFHVPSCMSKPDLTSGVAIAHVLHKIDPFWFNEAWLGRIKEESGDNWRLKVSNLKKILQSMMEYYHDVLGQQVADEHVPEVSLIGEMGNGTELGRLLQLVLGCAVSCEKKEEYIQQIMTLEESVQHVVMAAIQELLTKEPPEPESPDTYGDFDSQSRKYYFLGEDLEERDGLAQRCRQLEQQLSVLVEDKSSLQAELQDLKEKLRGCESPDASTTITGKKLLLLQTQIEQLQEENYRLDTSRDDLRTRNQALERDVMELTRLAQEAQALKDEMDVVRHSTDRVSRLEALVETYRRKLEDLGDLRRQVRLLEERNTVDMQRTCELEEELRRANAGRAQLDAYRRQVHELHTKHSSEAMKAEKWQFEYRNLNDKYEALLKEKERLLSERDALRETNEELRCIQVQQKCLGQADSLDSDTEAMSNLASEIIPTELKETVMRLQSENKMLCVQEETYRQRLGEVQDLLEEAQRSQNTLEMQNRLNQQQIAQLSSQVEELQRALQEQDSKAEDAISSLLQKKLEEHLEKLHEAHSDLQKKREVIDGLEPSVDSNMAKKIDELEKVLRKKDEDLRQMEERCKHYVEKARTVIKTLDHKQKPHTVPAEIQALRNQLSEKDRKIQHLEHDFEKTRSSHDQEAKLIISAWYNMGMALQQKVSGERGAPGQAQSFLAQQRQSTQARRSLATRLQPR